MNSTIQSSSGNKEDTCGKTSGKCSSQKADKRELIVESALQLILEKGYTNTRIIDIANRAGIGKGTVYAYFESKEDILVYLVNVVIKKDCQDIFGIIDSSAPARNKIAQYIKCSERLIEKYGPYAVLIKDNLFTGGLLNSDRLIDAVHEINRGQYMIIRNIIEEGIAAGEIRKIDIHTSTMFMMVSVGSYLAMKALSVSNSTSAGNLRSCYAREEMSYIETNELAEMVLHGISVGSDSAVNVAVESVEEK